MTTHLSRQDLQPILANGDIGQLSYKQIVEHFRAEEALGRYTPESIYQVDPRNGERILYSPARARRPHDNRPEPNSDPQPEGEACVICQGDTTGVLDVAELNQGFTFINKNLYPILYPHERSAQAVQTGNSDQTASSNRCADGLHFLQWTSSYHDRDWHNLPHADRVVVLKRLALLEEQLLRTGPQAGTQITYNGKQVDLGPFVAIIKNGGSQVGGSLSHGHQQIVFTNVVPRRTLEDWYFEQIHGETFSAYLQRENPADLLVRVYRGVKLVVPHFMRRPYNMILLVSDTRKRHIHELNQMEIDALAHGWHDAIRAIRILMPKLGREIAYNVVAHNGPGAGIYFEFLPYTQETGGFEHLGLAVCQADRREIAEDLRQTLEEDK